MLPKELAGLMMYGVVTVEPSQTVVSDGEDAASVHVCANGFDSDEKLRK